MHNKRVIIFNIILYFLIVIQGKHLGGILLLYFFLGLYLFAISSILMLIGTILYCLLFARRLYKKAKVIVPVASLFYYLGLFFFFFNDVQKNNYGSFTNSLFLITLGLFLVFNWYLNFRVFSNKG